MEYRRWWAFLGFVFLVLGIEAGIALWLRGGEDGPVASVSVETSR